MSESYGLTTITIPGGPQVLLYNHGDPGTPDSIAETKKAPFLLTLRHCSSDETEWPLLHSALHVSVPTETEDGSPTTERQVVLLANNNSTAETDNFPRARELIGIASRDHSDEALSNIKTSIKVGWDFLTDGGKHTEGVKCLSVTAIDNPECRTTVPVAAAMLTLTADGAAEFTDYILSHGGFAPTCTVQYSNTENMRKLVIEGRTLKDEDLLDHLLEELTS